MSDTESSLSVGGLGVGGDTSASASSADEAHDLSDAGASEGDEGLPSGQSMFESSFLKGLSNLRLRKLARAHGIATNLQPRAHIEEKLLAIPAREQPATKTGDSKKKLFSKEYLESLGKIQLRRLARQQKVSDVPDSAEQLRVVLRDIDDPSEASPALATVSGGDDASSVESLDVASDSEEEADGDDGEERDFHASEILQLSEQLPLTSTVTCPIQEGGFQTVFAGGGAVPQNVLEEDNASSHRRFYNIFVDGFVEGVPTPFGKACGLRDGDVIVSVNGVNTLGKGMSEVFQPMLKDHFANKTSVVFGIHRPGATAADHSRSGPADEVHKAQPVRTHAAGKNETSEDNSHGQKIFSEDHLRSLGQIQLKKLAKQNGVAVTGGLAALRARLGALLVGSAESTKVPTVQDSLYTNEYLSGLGRVRLLKLGRQHSIDTRGDLDALRKRLAALPAVSSADQVGASQLPSIPPADSNTTASSSKPAHATTSTPKVYSATHLKGLGQIQLRKLAKQHGLDTKGGPATLRVRLGALNGPADEKSASADGNDHATGSSESEGTDSGNSAAGDTTDAHESGAETTDMDVGVPPESSLGNPKYSKLHLAGLGQVQLRKLARENKLDTGGGVDALRQRLSALRLAVGAGGTATILPGGPVADTEVTSAGASVASHPNVSLKLAQALPASHVFKCPTKNGSLQTVFSGGDQIIPSTAVAGRRKHSNVVVLEFVGEDGEANGHKSGLRVGDIIVKLNGVTVLDENYDFFRHKLKGIIAAGDEAVFEVFRELPKDVVGSTVTQRLYSKIHLASLGQIQLRKLAKKHGLSTTGGPAKLRERLAEVEASPNTDATSTVSTNVEPGVQLAASPVVKKLSIAERREQRELEARRRSIYGDEGAQDTVESPTATIGSAASSPAGSSGSGSPRRLKRRVSSKFANMRGILSAQLDGASRDTAGGDRPGAGEVADGTSSSPTAEGLEKFLTMLRLGTPRAAVEKKMKECGLSPELLPPEDDVELSDPASVASAAAAVAAIGASATESPLLTVDTQRAHAQRRSSGSGFSSPQFKQQLLSRVESPNNGGTAVKSPRNSISTNDAPYVNETMSVQDELRRRRDSLLGISTPRNSANAKTVDTAQKRIPVKAGIIVPTNTASSDDIENANEAVTPGTGAYNRQMSLLNAGLELTSEDDDLELDTDGEFSGRLVVDPAFSDLLDAPYEPIQVSLSGPETSDLAEHVPFASLDPDVPSSQDLAPDIEGIQAAVAAATAEAERRKVQQEQRTFENATRTSQLLHDMNQLQRQAEAAEAQSLELGNESEATAPPIMLDPPRIPHDKDTSSCENETDTNLSEDELAHRAAVARRREAQDALAERLAAADAALAQPDAAKAVAVQRLDDFANHTNLPVAKPTEMVQPFEPPSLAEVLSLSPSGSDRNTSKVVIPGTPRRTSGDEDSVVLPSDSSDGLSDQKDANNPDGKCEDLANIVKVRPIKLADLAGRDDRAQPSKKLGNPSDDETRKEQQGLNQTERRPRSRSQSRRRHRPHARAEILAEPSPVDDEAASSTDDDHGRPNVATPPKGPDRFLDGERGVVWSPMQHAVATRLVVTFPVGETINVSIVGGERVSGSSVAPQQYTPIVVESVDPSSRAHTYQLRPGDELVSLNGTPVSGMSMHEVACLFGKYRHQDRRLEFARASELSRSPAQLAALSGLLHKRHSQTSSSRPPRGRSRSRSRGERRVRANATLAQHTPPKHNSKCFPAGDAISQRSRSRSRSRSRAEQADSIGTPLAVQYAGQRSFDRVQQRVHRRRAQSREHASPEATIQFPNGSLYLDRAKRDIAERQARLSLRTTPQRQSNRKGMTSTAAKGEQDFDEHESVELSGEAEALRHLPHQSAPVAVPSPDSRSVSEYRGSPEDGWDRRSSLAHEPAHGNDHKEAQGVATSQGDVILAEPLDSGGFGPRVGDVGVLVATHPFGKAAKFFWRDFGGAWTVPLARTRPAKQATSFDVAEALEPTPTSTAANMAENSVAQSSTSVQESTSERSRAGASSMSSFDDEQLLLGNPPSPLSGTPLGESVVTGQWALVRMSRGRGLIRKGFQDFERAFLAVSDDGHLLILRGTYDSIQQPFVAFSQSGSASSPMQTFHISPQWEADAKERPDGRGGCSVVWSLVIPPNNAASLQHQSPAQAGNWRAAPNGSPPLAARIGQEANPFRGIEGHVVSVLFPSADKFRSFAAIVRVSQLLGQRPRDWSALSDHVRDQQVEAGVYARLLQASHKAADVEVSTLHRLLYAAGRNSEELKTNAELEKQQLQHAHRQKVQRLKKQLDIFIDQQRGKDLNELREYLKQVVAFHGREKAALAETYRKKHSATVRKRDDMWRDKIRERDAVWKKWAADLQDTHDATLEAALQVHPASHNRAPLQKTSNPVRSTSARGSEPDVESKIPTAVTSPRSATRQQIASLRDQVDKLRGDHSTSPSRDTRSAYQATTDAAALRPTPNITDADDDLAFSGLYDSDNTLSV
eukprot:INCI1063.1.p1 GENE.INCI1063.1~~INCI1063.1.p1  ORF type:complete len:2495 (+),score=433.37 INCI1063.1:248-7732(+)